MGQADFPGPRDMSSANQASIGDRVVRGSKGSSGNQGLVLGHHAHDTEYLGCLDGFIKGNRRQDGRD